MHPWDTQGGIGAGEFLVLHAGTHSRSCADPCFAQSHGSVQVLEWGGMELQGCIGARKSHAVREQRSSPSQQEQRWAERLHYLKAPILCDWMLLQIDAFIPGTSSELEEGIQHWYL